MSLLTSKFKRAILFVFQGDSMKVIFNNELNTDVLDNCFYQILLSKIMELKDTCLSSAKV